MGSSPRKSPSLPRDYEQLAPAEVPPLRGFVHSLPRRVLYWIFCVLTGGIPLLLSRWSPTFRLVAQCRPTSLSMATFVLIEDECGKKDVVQVKELMLPPCSTPEPASPVHPLLTPIRLRYFLFHQERFVWSESANGFSKIGGLDGITAARLLDDFEGFSHSRRQQLRTLYGPNRMEVEVKSYWTLLVEEVLNPFYFFQLASVVLWTIDHYVYYASCVVIVSVLSIALSLFETKQQLQLLAKMANSPDTIVTVRRGNTEEELSSSDLVPGDVLLIPGGGMVLPCDCVLLAGSCLVNESMLTGESVPVAKSALPRSPDIYTGESMKRHTLFAGTVVLQTRFYAGNKVACLVSRTGFRTQKGSLIRSILYPKEVAFGLYADAFKFMGFLCLVASLGMAYAAHLYIERGSSWLVMIVRCLDIVTIVVPPALPAAMTVATVYAQSRLKAQLIFCISPGRINFCGKLRLVCFDKTGTLTEDGLDFTLAIPANEDGFEEAVRELSALPSTSPLLRTMATCHSLTHIGPNIVGDPLDLKMFGATKWELEEPMMSDGGSHRFDLLTPTVVKGPDVELGVIRELEFSPQLQRMSVIVRGLEGGMELYCKGAPERVRPLCHSVPADFDRVLDSFTVRGHRVLAVAWRPLPSLSWHHSQRAVRDELEKDLIFCGLLVMQNSLKKATVPVIDELRAAALRCVMVTGDNMLTALSVARECGMIPTCDKVVVVSADDEGTIEYQLAATHYEPIEQTKADTSDNEETVRSESVIDLDLLLPIEVEGQKLVKLSDTNYHFALNGRTWAILLKTASRETLQRIIAKGTVFARMPPEAKMQLVEALQELEYVVAMCGDGANDCSALKAAHVGISLSEAEASVAAPFTSKVADVSCVPAVVREGRCALATSFATFKFMALYSMVQFTTVLLLYANWTNLADMQFLFIDLGIITTVAVVMGRTGPYHRLVPEEPMGSLVTFQNVFSISSQILAAMAVQVSALLFLRTQPWFEPVKPKDGDELITKCWETTTLFSVSTFQYILLAVVFSKGPPFRKPFYTNSYFIGLVAVLVGLSVIIAIYPPDIVAHILDLEPLSGIEGIAKNEFRFSLLLFPVANLVLAFALEYGIAENPVLKNFRLFGKKHNRKYEEVLEDLASNLSWPPIKSP